MFPQPWQQMTVKATTDLSPQASTFEPNLDGAEPSGSSHNFLALVANNGLTKAGVVEYPHEGMYSDTLGYILLHSNNMSH
jgi:hypothetical protein